MVVSSFFCNDAAAVELYPPVEGAGEEPSTEEEASAVTVEVEEEEPPVGKADEEDEEEEEGSCMVKANSVPMAKHEATLGWCERRTRKVGEKKEKISSFFSLPFGWRMGLTLEADGCSCAWLLALVVGVHWSR